MAEPDYRVMAEALNEQLDLAVREAEKWKALARKHERQAKANANVLRTFGLTVPGERGDGHTAAERAVPADGYAPRLAGRENRS